MAIIKFNFLKDEPLTKENENFFGFYHDIIAPALKKVLKEKSSPHTIGLFGSWGTGKSTIVELLREDKGLGLPIFVFDAWKYREDPLRRSFLTALVRFINQTPEIEAEVSIDELLDKLYKTKTESVSTTETVKPQKQEWHKRVLRWLKRNWFLTAAIVACSAWIALQIFVKKNVYLSALRDAFKTLAGLSVVIIVFKPVLESILKNSVDKLMKPIAIASAMRTQTQIEERLDSPEQFEDVFKEIVKAVNKKMIIVFDNIDRVDGDSAISMLATIKTFLDPANNSGLVFLIPCDAEAINQQITKYYDTNLDDGDFDSSEYLRKVFNLVVWVPEFITTDLEEYTKNKLAATGDIKSIINKEDVALVINSAFSKNPREIIQFINNLVAATLVARETKVWSVIEKDIAYLTKVLVLKQKFPAAYKQLKEKWYEPENILGEKPPEALSEFMNLTTRITVQDAEPFIYFKTPLRSSKLRGSDELRSALTSGVAEDVTVLIKKENKDNDVAQFISDLLIKYAGQPRVLLNIFLSQITAFNELGVQPTIRSYFETSIRTLDSHLWQDYKKLPVSLIFPLLASTMITAKQRAQIIDRYIAALSTDENPIGQDMEFVSEIIGNFIKYPDLLNTSQKNKVRGLVEDNFSESNEVLSLFKTKAQQDIFVAPLSFKNYLSTLTTDNITVRADTIVAYKDFAVAHQQIETLVSKLNELINGESAQTPDHNDTKTALLNSTNKIFNTYQNELDAQEAVLTQLGTTLIQSYARISAPYKRVIINTMRWVSLHAPEATKNELTVQINDFFQSSDLESIRIVFDYWNSSSAQSFLRAYLPALLPRSISQPDILGFIYETGSDASKTQIILNLIRQPGAADINFLASLKQLPSRAEIIKALLAKTATLSSELRPPYYSFIAKRLYLNDARDIKASAIDQISELLKTDSPPSQQAAYDFMTQASFITETQKREISKGLLEWLRQSGKVITSEHSFALKSLVSVFDVLQASPQKDFIYLLFNILSSEHDLATIKVVLELLGELKPSYNKYKKDYDDVLERLQSWEPDDERKQYINQNISLLKPANPGVREAKYWSQFNQ